MDGTIIVVCPLLPSNNEEINPTVPMVPSIVMLALFKNAQSVMIKFETSFTSPIVGQSVKFTQNQSNAVVVESQSIASATFASIVIPRIGNEYCVVMSAVHVSPVDLIREFSEELPKIVVFCQHTSLSPNKSTVLVK